LIADLYKVLQEVETDMTIFYRCLATLTVSDSQADDDVLVSKLCDAFYRENEITPSYKKQLCTWLRRYLERVKQDRRSDEERHDAMNKVNPKYIFRNYLAQLATDKAEQGDFSMVNELLDVFRHPYDAQPDKEHYAVKRPEWARERAGCSMLSCSS